MALTDIQRRQLNQQCNRMPLNKLIEYIEKGMIIFPDDLPELNDERRQAIAQQMASRPNPMEQQEWSAIVPLLGQDDGPIKQMLINYVTHWSSSAPTGNHIAEAKAKLSQIEETERIRTAAIEENDWNVVNHQDATSLAGHIRKYPSTSHKNEIDESLWMLVTQNGNNELVQLYKELFPEGLHITEVNAIASELEKWKYVSENCTIEELYTYMTEHPTSPFMANARQKMKELKLEEVTRMKELQSNYPVEDLFFYIEKGIFSEAELIDSGVATPESLAILRKLDEMKDSLPDVNEEIRKCRRECAEGHTDVFLFGIPSTGKTCILMGLIGSPNININTVRAGGPYSCVLEQYLDSGFTIGQTPKDFVATIEAEIIDGKNKHLLNLVEMAGEDFAFKIADNENGMISFEDIGAGATQLLCNNNKKVFFIIVDPTAKTVRFNHLVNETDEFGNVRTYLVTRNVNQKIILKRMVDLLSQPENSGILRNVDSIHIIISKADVLGYGQEREAAAYERFMQQHQNIVGPLTELCRANGINLATNGVPMLYTFSLGRFYVGGIYQYDPTDANKLVEVLKGNTEITKQESFWSKVRGTLN